MTFDADPIDPERSLRWAPGLGPDPDALDRLVAAFPKPREPMGEAWFMSEERRMYRDLLGDLGDVQPDVIFDALFEIASGPTCFGKRDEWTEWFHYLLPRLTLGAHAGPIWTTAFEPLATAFFVQHPDSSGAEPYPGFRNDVLLTLGRVLMDPECWPGGRIDIEQCLDKGYLPGLGRWLWDQPSGVLSAALFLHLKYLPASEIGPWLDSACRIGNAHWRAQILAWFGGVHAFLTGALEQPADEPEEAWPGTSWYNSFLLRGGYTGTFSVDAATPFIPPENREAALPAIRACLPLSTLLTWIDSFAVDPILKEESSLLPDLFVDLYKPT